MTLANAGFSIDVLEDGDGSRVIELSLIAGPRFLRILVTGNGSEDISSESPKPSYVSRIKSLIFSMSVAVAWCMTCWGGWSELLISFVNRR